MGPFRINEMMNQPIESYGSDDRGCFEYCLASCGGFARVGGRGKELLHLSLRHLELRDGGRLVQAVNSRSTAAHQLGGSEGRQYHELKRTDSWRTLNHRAPPNRRGPETVGSDVSAWDDTLIDIEPSQQGFGEGYGLTGRRAQKSKELEYTALSALTVTRRHFPFA